VGEHAVLILDAPVSYSGQIRARCQAQTYSHGAPQRDARISPMRRGVYGAVQAPNRVSNRAKIMPLGPLRFDE
jgi:hypothetical protein